MQQNNTKEGEQIIQGNNELIARFMHDGNGSRIWTSDGKGGRTSYNNSWNWLMSVVEKIESLGYEVQIGKYLYRINDYYYCIIHNQGNSTYFETDKSERISAVWYAAIDFITWFNTIKNKQ